MARSGKASKEASPSRPIDMYYEASLKEFEQDMNQAKTGKRVIKGKDLPWRQDRQGIIRRYCHPLITDNALDTWHLFVHEVHTHSGKHVHQGGLCLFVLQGKGYTVVDGVRHNWEKGDVIMLPVKQGGVEHQHFNLDDKPSRWLAMIPIQYQRTVGHKLVQKEYHPNWKGLP